MGPVARNKRVMATVLCVWGVEEVGDESGFGRDRKRIRKIWGKGGWWEMICGRRNGGERRVMIREWEAGKRWRIEEKRD